MSKMKNIFKILSVFAIMIVASVFFASCSSTKEDISLSCEQTEVYLVKGEEVQIDFIVENFEDKGSVTLSIFEDFVASNTSKIIDFEKKYEDGKTSVLITGLKGGRTILTATTDSKEAKKIQVEIVVKEFSTSLEMNNKTKGFISQYENFTPSNDMFNFSQNATETYLDFYLITSGVINSDMDKSLEFESLDNDTALFRYGNDFVEAEKFSSLQLSEDNEKIVINGNLKDVEIEIGAKTRFYFIADYESELFALNYFDYHKGISTEDIKIEKSGVEVEKINLIVGDALTAEYGFKVAIPTGLELDVEFDEDIVSVTQELNSSDETEIIYDFNVTYLTLRKALTQIEYNLYYPGFKNQGESVSVTKTIEVEIVVKADSVKVNGLEEANANNNYVFFDYYLNLQYGWQEFDIAVYPTDASFTGVKIEFDEDLIQVKQKTYLSSGDIIEDLDNPLQIRGMADCDPADSKSIKLTLQDRYSEIPLVYNINYSTNQGAKEIAFNNQNYIYDANNEDSGVFVENNLQTYEFVDLYADKSFEFATVVYVSNSNVARVEYFGKDEKTIKLKITSKKVGTETVKIVLDNGVSVDLVIKVVDIFENLYVKQDTSSENSGIQSVIQGEEGDEIALTAVLKNEIYEEGYSYNKKLSIKLFSESENVITSSSLIFSEGDLGVAKGSNQNYTLQTIDCGEFIVECNAEGFKIEDFKRVASEQKLKIKMISINPVKSFVLSNEDDEIVSYVKLYADDLAEDEQRFAKFKPVVKNDNAFNFFNISTNTYLSENFDNKFIYWTTNCTIKKDGDIVDFMVYGNKYELFIGKDYIGMFDTELMEFIANTNNKTGKFSLFANLTQYGAARSCGVVIELKNFIDVESISTSFALNDLNFDIHNKKHILQVSLKESNATNKNITIFVDNLRVDLVQCEHNVNRLNFVIKDDEISNSFIDFEKSFATLVGDGVYVLNIICKDVLADNDARNQLLKIVPTSWIGSSNTILNYSYLRFNLSFSDGSVLAPYKLVNAEDILAIKDAPDAYYIIENQIDMSGYSSHFPICDFSGVILGRNNAKIYNIIIDNVDENNYAGIFSTNSGLIENIAFEGKFDLNEGNCIGLICAENTGVIRNISVNLLKSSIKLPSKKLINIGGICGENKGSILSVNLDNQDYLEYINKKNISINEELILKTYNNIYIGTNKAPIIYMNDFFEIQIVGDIDYKSNIGGISGENTGEISSNLNDELLGYSAYMAYSLIKTVETNISVNLGGICGSITDGSVFGMTVGGEVICYNNKCNVGGIAGYADNADIGKKGSINFETITRTFVRGFNAGALTGQENNVSFGNNIKIQAVEDGVKVNEDSAMIIRRNSSSFSDLVTDTQKNSFIATGNGAYELFDDSYSSYFTRTFINVFDLEDDDVFQNSTNEFYGDFLIVDIGKVKPKNKILHQYAFEKASSSISTLQENKLGGCVKMECDDIDQPEMFLMFYYQAEEYLDMDGNYSTYNLQKVQDILDANMNTLHEDANMIPFVVDKNTVIKSNDERILKINQDGSWQVKGTGIVELQLKNLLNSKLTQTVLINVVHYFNNIDFANETSILPSVFVYEGNRLSESVDLKVFKNQNVNINILASNTNLNFGNEIYLNNGILNIQNQQIRLKQNRDIFATCEYISDKNFNLSFSKEGIVISKKSGAITNKDTTDAITINAEISCSYNNKIYSYAFPENAQVVLNLKYFEGVSAVYSKYDEYSINSGSKQSDKITIETDDDNKNIYYQIYKNDNLLQENDWNVSTEAITGYDFDQNEVDSELFNLSIEKNKISININKDSKLYMERYENDIYGEYKLRFFGASNQNIYKEILLTVDDNAMDSVIVENFADINELRVQSNKIVPAQEGVLSIVVNPVDADFKRIKISNNVMNSASGSAKASFVFGYFDSSNNFVSINSNVQYYPDGSIAIKKSDLFAAIGSEKYNGQFFVKYYLFNSASVQDGAPVAFDVLIEDINNDMLFEQTINLSIDKQFFFNVGIKDKLPQDENYLLAKGLEYVLEVENHGYDSDSIKISTSNNEIAEVVKNGSDYILKINQSTAESFSLTATATRINASNKEVKEKVEIENIKVMDYVVNFNPTAQNGNLDIVNGMQDGIVSVAVSTKFDFAIDFNNYSMIEFDRSNNITINKVDKFLKDLTTGGTWTMNLLNETTNEFVSSTITNTSNSDEEYFDIKGLSLIINKEHNPEVDKKYFINFKSKIKIDGSGYIIGDGDKEIFAEFAVDSYILGSEESPNPISSYAEGDAQFLNMKQGAHYILTDDLYVSPQTFAPHDFVAESFDGNSFNIVFKTGDYDISQWSNVGLFSEIAKDSTIKNLTIILEDNVRFVTTEKEDAVNFGLVAASNSGNITNACVKSGEIRVVFDFTDKSLPKNTTISGMVGKNLGNLTHSRFYADIVSKGSISGLVSVNSGIISSCFVKNSYIENTSTQNDSFSSAGLVLDNNESGVIIGCYVSGVVNSSVSYCKNLQDSKLKSTVQVAGFVFNNVGAIRDCYSNIPIDSTSKTAGFVFKNGGQVSKCFSTSIILHGASQLKNGFAESSVIEVEIEQDENVQVVNKVGLFENCYFLSDSDKGINQSLSTTKFEGVKPLNIDGFNNVSNFEAYSFGKTQSNYNNIWVYIEDGVNVEENAFKQIEIVKDEGNNFVEANTEPVQFASGRLELVSANIVASSFKQLQDEVVDENDNVINYEYEQKINYGSLHNPFVIDSAETFEDCMSPNDKYRINFNHFRIINEIDYNEISNRVSTCDMVFKGIIEGNGMTFKNMDIFSTEKLEYAGLLSSIQGSSINSNVGVQNLTLLPKSVLFPNANVVGSLAGNVEFANIVNVEVFSTLADQQINQESLVVAIGKNIVGGVVGLIGQNVQFVNISSSVAARATKMFGDVASFEQTVFNGYSILIDDVSYAGGVAGFVKASSSATSYCKNILAQGDNLAVIASKAGLIFGGVSQFVEVDNVKVDINENMQLVSNMFAGFIAGESAGEWKNIIVNGNKQLVKVFNTKEQVPNSVGGVFGWMIEGCLSNVLMQQSFEIVSRKNSMNISLDVLNIGGIVGKAGQDNINSSKCDFEDIIMNASIESHGTLGGIIGYSNAYTDINTTAIYENKLIVSGKLKTAVIGGFVGNSNNYIKINNSYSHAQIVANIYEYGLQMDIVLNSILGIGKLNASSSNIYTTTTCVVDAEDKTTLNKKDFVRYVIDEENSTNDGWYIDDQKNENITINLATDESNNNIYHYIAKFNADNLDSYNDIIGVTTGLQFKMEEVAFVYTQKEFGKSILEKVENAPKLPSLDMFKGIMMEKDTDNNLVNITGWENTENGNNILPYLSFEQDFREKNMII